MMMGEFETALFNENVKSFIWVEWAQTDGSYQISIGQESECDEENAVLKFSHVPVRYDQRGHCLKLL